MPDSGKSPAHPIPMTAGEQGGGSSKPGLWFPARVWGPACPTCVNRGIRWALPATGNPDGQVTGEGGQPLGQREREPSVPFSPLPPRVCGCLHLYPHSASGLFGLNPVRPCPPQKLSKYGPSSLGAQSVSQQTALGCLLYQVLSQVQVTDHKHQITQMI